MLTSSQYLLEKVLDKINANPKAIGKPEVVKLPDWGLPLADVDLRQAGLLKGGHLILTDRDAEDRIGFRALDTFSRLGISGISYLPKFRDDMAAEICFNAAPRWLRVPSLLILFARRKAVVTNRRLAAPFNPIGFHVGEDGRCETPIIKQLDIMLDETGEPEQFQRFMIFEGLRQLVPVRNTHDHIARARDGRYSLWNRRLTFTPTETSRLFSYLYWLVENTSANQKFLPYFPVRQNFQDKRINSRDDAVEELASMFELHKLSAPRQLRKGDTIVVATHALPPGGAERQWAYLAVGLKRAGYDVRFVVYRKLLGVDAHYANLLEAEGIPILDPDSVQSKPFSLVNVDDSLLWMIFRAKIVDDLPKLWRFVQLLKQIDPKAVYVQLDEPNIYLCLAALVVGVYHIIPSFRNTNPSTFAYHRHWYRTAYQIIARSSRVKMSGNSHLANQDYADWLGLGVERITCIPNALDDELFRRASRDDSDALKRALGLRQDDNVILGVFRFAEEKNPLCFLRTVARVAREVRPLRVLIVGVGRLGDMLAQEVQTQGLSEIVTILGQRSDVNVLMAIADLLLLTSNHEGLPNVVLEAQLSGLPVVATDVGGTSEALQSGKSGLLCPANDDAALARACVDLLTNRGFAHRMGEAGTAFVHNKFGLAIMTERYLALADVKVQTDDDYDR